MFPRMVETIFETIKRNKDESLRCNQDNFYQQHQEDISYELEMNIAEIHNDKMIDLLGK